MIRVFKIVKEFGTEDFAYLHMVNVARDDIDKLVCVGNLVYSPLGGGRVFQVDNLIMPAVISMDDQKEVHISRVTKDNLIKLHADDYIAVDRKHSFVVHKLPGMRIPLIVHLEGIETVQLASTNFDKRMGY